MAALTASATEAPAPGVLRKPAVRKLGVLLLLAAVLVPFAVSRWGSGAWPGALTVDLSGPLGTASDWIVDNRDSHPLFLYFLGHVSNVVVIAVRAVYLALLAVGWAGVTAVAALTAWRVAGIRVALGTAAAFLACGLLGMWVPTMQTLALMVVAVAASVVVGALLGLGAGLSDRVHRGLRPVLDTMQVLPAFAYLLPVVLVFGIGVPAAVLATVVYAAPPMARLTALGLRGADKEVLEAVESLDDRAPAPADRPYPAGPQGTAARPQPDDHDGAVHGRHRFGDRRGRPRRPRLPGARLGRRGRRARRRRSPSCCWRSSSTA